MPLAGFTRDATSGIDWFIWAPVMREKAHLTELKTTWTLADLLMFHDALAEADRLHDESTRGE